MLGPLAMLPVLAVAVLLAGAPASFATLFVYFVAAAASTSSRGRPRP